MLFRDFSPSASPDGFQQTDALRKGLGRAVIWAQAGCLDDAPLLEACQRDYRYDIQMEDNRGSWLWGLLQYCNATDRFRDQILTSFQQLQDERDAYQFRQLARHFAEAGDEDFRRALYLFAEEGQFDAQYPGIGHGQILVLDGEAGFQFIARLRGTQLKMRPWRWDDEEVLDRATEQFGQQRVDDILSSSSDPSIRQFANSRASKRAGDRNRDSRLCKEKLTAIPLSEVFETAEMEDRATWLRNWGVHADTGLLSLVLDKIGQTEHPRVLANLLRVFSHRPLPRIETRLFELCGIANERVQQGAFNALSNCSDPSIRQFALDHLQDPSLRRWIMSLFRKNYELGDERLFLEVLNLPEDADDRHSLLIDLMGVVNENSACNGLEIVQVIYFETPCGHCREGSVEILEQMDAVPAWLAAECLHDANENCRKPLA